MRRNKDSVRGYHQWQNPGRRYEPALLDSSQYELAFKGTLLIFTKLYFLQKVLLHGVL